MKANQINGAALISSLSAGRASFPSADWRLRNLRSPSASVIPSDNRLRMMSLTFSISVWLSSLTAIWMSRGWIGLFLSGQLLSAAAGLCKCLPEMRQAAVRKIESIEPFEGVHDGL